jgi:hypothetical protein
MKIIVLKINKTYLNDYKIKYRNIKYHHYCPNENDNTKIYNQISRVDYADYLPRKYYVSVYDVC